MLNSYSSTSIAGHAWIQRRHTKTKATYANQIQIPLASVRALIGVVIPQRVKTPVAFSNSYKNRRSHEGVSTRVCRWRVAKLPRTLTALDRSKTAVEQSLISILQAATRK